MKRVVMAALMFTIASCAVDRGLTETSTWSTSTADEADYDNNEVSRSTPDRDADPNAVPCSDFCVTIAQCRAMGGTVNGVCINGKACCEPG